MLEFPYLLVYNWKKAMIKKRETSKSFLDISNTYVKGAVSTNITETHAFLRRKSEKFFQVIKNQSKLKENHNELPKAYNHPPKRPERSGSQVFNKTFDHQDSKQLESYDSLATSTVTPPLSKRFQRKSQRKLEVNNAVIKQKLDSICSQSARPAQEQAGFLVKNRKLLQQCERVQKENERLRQQLKQKDNKISLLTIALKDKENELMKASSTLKDRQTAFKQLEESLGSKAKLMIKLQEKTNQLQAKLSEIRKNKTVDLHEAEFSQKMNLVMQRLRYKEMEVHILKKELFEIKEIEKKYKTASKENTQLKERIKYLVRRRYTAQLDGQSTSSLSYSCLSFSPDQI